MTSIKKHKKKKKFFWFFGICCSSPEFSLCRAQSIASQCDRTYSRPICVPMRDNCETDARARNRLTLERKHEMLERNHDRLKLIDNRAQLRSIAGQSATKHQFVLLVFLVCYLSLFTLCLFFFHISFVFFIFVNSLFFLVYLFYFIF